MAVNWQPSKIALIDNFDSFTYNLSNLLSEVSPKADIMVFRSDQDLQNIVDFNPHCVFISPGPSHPNKNNLSYQSLYHYAPKKLPHFGVCLGMQYINEFFGGSTEIMVPPVHGKTSWIEHSKEDLFANIPYPLKVARYHSLKINCTEELKVTAHFNDVPMAIQHKTLPIAGVQFHPESFMSTRGSLLIENYYSWVGRHV